MRTKKKLKASFCAEHIFCEQKKVLPHQQYEITVEIRLCLCKLVHITNNLMQHVFSCYILENVVFLPCFFLRFFVYWIFHQTLPLLCELCNYTFCIFQRVMCGIAFDCNLWVLFTRVETYLIDDGVEMTRKKSN